jgi:hypothetical protein
VRQAILVLVLVAASFLGGAFVNGPGLQWVQSKVLRSIGLNSGGEITSVDLKPAQVAGVHPGGLAPASSEVGGTQGPVAPMPSLVAEDQSSEDDASNQQLSSRDNRSSAPRKLGLQASQATPRSASSKKDPISRGKSTGRDLAPSDPSVAPVGVVSSPTALGSAPHVGSNVPPALLDSLSDLVPSGSSHSAPGLLSLPSPSPQSSPTPKAITSRSDDWPVLERKMQSVGVSHFTIEGEPNGRVVFSCLIPIAGRRAVAQRFEGDGDDMVQAAQAALQRIALWQATQPPSP